MSTREAPTRGEGIIAYTLSALTTLLWVGCVLPAGAMVDPASGPDAATPVYRDAILIVPAPLRRAPPCTASTARSRAGCA